MPDLPLSRARTHLLRHSRATNLLRRGASLGEIGQLLRHRQPTTTQIYAKVQQEHLRTMVSKLKPLVGEVGGGKSRARRLPEPKWLTSTRDDNTK